MKKVNNISKRCVALIISVIMLVSMLPAGMFTAFALPENKGEGVKKVVDTGVSGLEASYTFINDQCNEYNDIYYTQGETKIDFTVAQAIFNTDLIKVNNIVRDVAWTPVDGEDKWTGEITLTGNGDYIVMAESYAQKIHIDNDSHNKPCPFFLHS